MNVRLLGPVEVVGADGRPVALGSPKERLLFAALAIHAGRIVSEDQLLDALWGESPPRTATKTLQSYVSRLRRALGPGGPVSIESTASGYVLRTGAEGTDVERVEQLVGEAREASARGDHARAAALLREAEGLWVGPVLGDLRREPFAVAEVARLEELRLVVVESRIEAELAAGRHVGLTAELEALTARHPLRERLWAAQMLALYRAGRQADALKTYQVLREHLVDQLGIEPGPELRSLERAILRHDPGLSLPASPTHHRPAPSGIVTFLVSDIASAGSTSALSPPPEALSQHAALLGSAAEAHEGVLVAASEPGHPVVTVFSRASDAARAALAVRQMLGDAEWPEDVELPVRMALHTGEALGGDGGYVGPGVERALRLLAVVQGSETVVSRSAAEILIDDAADSWTLVELGERSLHGLGRPEFLFRLTPRHDRQADRRVGEPDAATEAHRASPQSPELAVPDLPRPFRPPRAFVGRTRELEALGREWEAVITGGGNRVVVLSGEPGVGKTSLAAAFAREVHASGAIVLAGHCLPDVAVPYQPFAEPLATLAACFDPEVLAMLPGAARLSRLLPDLASVLPAPPHPGSDPDAERLEVFEALASLVSSAAAAAPVLLVLDDLHWATSPTLLLLRFLLHTDPSRRLLVVGTYRDTEVARSHPLSETLAGLRRDARLTRIPVGGLDVDDIASLLVATTGTDDAGIRRFARDLHRQTSGNAFFASEVIRHLVETGTLTPSSRRIADVDPLVLPEGIRDVVTRRVGALSEEANRALRVAALIGPTFELAVLDAVPDAADDPDALVTALEEAVTAGLLREESAPASLAYSFSHEYVRQSLVEALTSTRRVRLHRAIGEALERIPPATGMSRNAALAHHFGEAAVDGQAEKAARYALAAAREARRHVAHEEALAHLERAVDVLHTGEVEAPRLRAEINLEISDLLGWLHPRDPRVREAALQAAGDARLADCTDHLVTAAVLFQRHAALGVSDPLAEALLLEALERIEQGDDDRRVALLAELSFFRGAGQGRAEEAERLADEALSLARARSDDSLVLQALHAKGNVLLGSPRVSERLEIARVMAELAERLDQPMALARALSYQITAHLELGDPAGADFARSAMERLAERTAGWYPTYYLTADRIMRALLAGDWQHAEEAATELLQHSGNDTNALNTFAGVQFVVARQRGLLPAQIELLATLVAEDPTAGYRAGYALALAEAGRLDDARRELRALAEDGFACVPHDQSYPLVLSLLAEVATITDDREAAVALTTLLSPYQGLLLTPVGACICNGAADRFLGMLALTLHRLDDAEEHFRRAIDAETRAGAPPHVVTTQAWYARLLLERAGPGDTERARAMLASAEEKAAVLGMTGLAEEIQALLRPPVPGPLVLRAPFVGRDDELAALRAFFFGGDDSRGRPGCRAMLVAGEPGIGKTSLAGAFAAEVHAAGGLIAYGRCDAGLGIAFQPFAEALPSIVESVPRDALGALQGLRELMRLVPKVSERVPGVHVPAAGDPETERWVLFEAVVDILRLASSSRPVLLVLDDLHWAAKPSLLLLRHILRSSGVMDVMVLGTYRDTELDGVHPLREVLADFRRDRLVERLPLLGLGREGVTALLETAVGRPLDDEGRRLAESLLAETAGNPFFLAETLRHLEESGGLSSATGRWVPREMLGETGIPEGIRDVVTRRLARLSDVANRVLVLGAVIGPAFNVQLVERLHESEDEDEVIDALDEAVASGLLVETAGEYAFAHALIRQTVLEDLTSTRRIRLHRRIGEALEQLAEAGTLAAEAEALARHFLEAAADGQVEKSARYALDAARQAAGRFAYEDAIAWLDHALEALDLEPARLRTLRCDVLVQLAEYRSVLGPRMTGRRDAIRAAKEALEGHDVQRLTQAVVTSLRFGQVGAVDDELSDLLETGLVLAGDDRAARSQLLAGLSFLKGSNGEGRRALASALADEAVALAEEVGYRAVLARALHARASTLLGTTRTQERAALGAEMIRLADGDSLLVAYGTAYQATSAFETGDLATFERLADEMADLFERTRSWYPGYFARSWDVMRAQLEGRWDDAERAHAALLDHGADDMNARNVWAANQYQFHRELGRSAEICPVLEEHAQRNPGIAAFEAALVNCLAEIGRVEEAFALLDKALDIGFEQLPQDQVWPITVSLYSEAAVLLGHAGAIEGLWELFAPYSGLMLAPASATFHNGAVDRHLAMLAAATSRFDDAETLFRAAIRLEEAMRARPSVVRTRIWFGRMLLARGRPGDDREAVDHLQHASADAQTLAMPALAAEAQMTLDGSGRG